MQKESHSFRFEFRRRQLSAASYRSGTPFPDIEHFLDNAVSYSPENSNIEIQTRQTAKEFTFLIIDHGCGISEKDKPFIFDRFYCADKSRTNKSHFGLGLSIAKELARMLVGKIGFEDTFGGGTTFFLTLPLK